MREKYYPGSKDGVIFYIFDKAIHMVHAGTEAAELWEAEYKKRGGIRERAWLRKVEKESRHYLETGIGGSYETAGLHNFEDGGEEIALFDDTDIKEHPNGIVLERKMIVGGKRFQVQSVFGADGDADPTDKLLKLIDGETG